ncbi:MAG: hypothetical protein KDI02_17485 [Anaerolineae bacterium]|nr:hypothetical protein [Anaerolineae bacterium]MCB0225485.1 hypothetical protein [Anaerolineae bacterium]
MLTNNQVKTNKKQYPAWKAALTGLSLLLTALVLFGPLAGVALAGQDKVAICHLKGNGSYKVINVSENALDAHLNHGDKIVGVDVDENCEPLGSADDADSDGVLDAQDNCVDVANPNQEDRYGTTAGDACEDVDGDGTLDVNEANFCLSIDGVLLENRGTAVCDSSATTGQEPNIAIADGDVAEAYAGVNSDGTPSDSDNNQATALGYEAFALATNGDNNSATATGDYASAGALGGNNNSAIATGESAYASANIGNNNSATATGYRASAQAYSGDNNSATATGDNLLAIARDGNNNSATATTTYTCAGKGDSDETAVNEDLCNN